MSGHVTPLGALDLAKLAAASSGPDDEPLLTLSDGDVDLDLTVDLPDGLIPAADALDRTCLTLLAHALRLRRIARGEP